MKFNTQVNNGDFVYFLFGQKIHTGEVLEIRIFVKKVQSGDLIISECDIKDSDGRSHTIETRYAFKTRKELIKSL